MSLATQIASSIPERYHPILQAAMQTLLDRIAGLLDRIAELEARNRHDDEADTACRNLLCEERDAAEAQAIKQLNRALAAEERADAFRRCLHGIQPIHPGPYLFEFSDYEDWCDFAQTRFKNAGEDSTSTICLDRLGRTCWRGKDFQQAHDDETFPVKVFSLRR